MKDMTVKLVLVEDELVALVHIAPRKELRLKEEFLVKLLELNGADDFVKFVLSAIPSTPGSTPTHGCSTFRN